MNDTPTTPMPPAGDPEPTAEIPETPEAVTTAAAPAAGAVATAPTTDADHYTISRRTANWVGGVAVVFVAAVLGFAIGHQTADDGHGHRFPGDDAPMRFAQPGGQDWSRGSGQGPHAGPGMMDRGYGPGADGQSAPGSGDSGSSQR